MTITDMQPRTISPGQAPTRPDQTLARADEAGTAAALQVLGALVRTLAEVADVDPAELGSGSPRGRELLDLAALGHRTTAVLGGDAGTVVTTAPGVVVVRELVAVTRALRSAMSETGRH